MCQLPKFWDILVERMGRTDLLEDPRFAGNEERLTNRDVLTDILDAEFRQQTMAYWQELLAGFVPVALVYTLASAMDNPWLQTIGMRDSVDHPDRPDLQILASPIKVNGQRLPNRAAPLLGADNDAILADLGYDAAAIAELHKSGVV
jgi:crotonobetainyl-CoA:carnitine CoA-transferase CaiB-like acyl-CoA transferase